MEELSAEQDATKARKNAATASKREYPAKKPENFVRFMHSPYIVPLAAQFSTNWMYNGCKW